MVAGIYDEYLGMDGTVLVTFTALTCHSCTKLRWLHDRQPVVLDLQGKWWNLKPIGSCSCSVYSWYFRCCRLVEPSQECWRTYPAVKLWSSYRAAISWSIFPSSDEKNELFVLQGIRLLYSAAQNRANIEFLPKIATQHTYPSFTKLLKEVTRYQSFVEFQR